MVGGWFSITKQRFRNANVTSQGYNIPKFLRIGGGGSPFSSFLSLTPEAEWSGKSDFWMWSLENEQTSDSSEDESQSHSHSPENIPSTGTDLSVQGRDDGVNQKTGSLPSFDMFDKVQRPAFLPTADTPIDDEKPRSKDITVDWRVFTLFHRSSLSKASHRAIVGIGHKEINKTRQYPNELENTEVSTVESTWIAEVIFLRVPSLLKTRCWNSLAKKVGRRSERQPRSGSSVSGLAGSRGLGRTSECGNQMRRCDSDSSLIKSRGRHSYRLSSSYLYVPHFHFSLQIFNTYLTILSGVLPTPAIQMISLYI